MWWLLIQESKQRPKIIKNNLRQVIPLRALRFLAGREARLPRGHSKDWCPRKMTVCNVLYIAGTVENCTLWGKQCLDLVNQYRWETQPTCEYLALMVQEPIRAAEELKPWQTRHTACVITRVVALVYYGVIPTSIYNGSIKMPHHTKDC